jgi:anti-sigma factor RsiW
MKEHPPYSLPEIRLVLSEYLDGALDPDKVVEVELLIEQYPEYKQALLKLQATRDTVQAAFERQVESEDHELNASNALWKKLSQQLEADQAEVPSPFDFEFVSAYYDGEIPASDPAFQVFESQLSNNPEANRLLADAGAVSETVRQYGYRLESACTLDITQSVMQAFAAEQNPQAVVEPELERDALEPAVETVSTYFDQELSARETIEANRLIENDPKARRLLGSFNRLSEQIRSITEQVEAQAPDCWNAVREELARQPDDGVVIPMPRGKQAKRLLRVAFPAAAAAVLVLLTLPAAQFSPPGSVQELSYKARVEKIGTNRSELASVPMAAASGGMMTVSADGAGAPMLEDAVYRPSRMAQPLSSPEVAPSEPMAVRPDDAPDQRAGKKVPSSEEYLFEALSEQMPDEDVSAIFGP